MVILFSFLLFINLISITDFFSYNNSMALARLIVKMNEIINNQDGDVEIRKRAVVLLHSMVKQFPPERASTVSLYSSGLCTAVAKLLKGGTNIPSLIKSALLVSAVHIYFSSINIFAALQRPRHSGFRRQRCEIRYKNYQLG